MRIISDKTLVSHKSSFKSTGYLLPPLHRYVVRKVMEDSANSTRRSDIMHPSEMCKPGWCSRKDFYRITLGKRQDTEDPQFGTELIFAEGHAIHHKYQLWLRNMGLLYGRYQCDGCRHSFHAQSPDVCPSCSGTSLKYREVPLENLEYMISGHADGAVNVGNDLLVVDEPFLIEIKSIGLGSVRVEAPELYRKYVAGGNDLVRLWTAINRPFAAHLRQATLYCWLAGYKKMVFIYESKWNQQTKEFVVVPDFGHIQWMLDGAKDVAQGVRQGIEPYRPGWAKQDHRTCKACPFRTECWGEEGTKPDDTDRQPVSIRRSPTAVRRKALRPT